MIVLSGLPVVFFLFFIAKMAMYLKALGNISVCACARTAALCIHALDAWLLARRRLASLCVVCAYVFFNCMVMFLTLCNSLSLLLASPGACGASASLRRPGRRGLRCRPGTLSLCPLAH
jgi:hypothetical protein